MAWIESDNRRLSFGSDEHDRASALTGERSGSPLRLAGAVFYALLAAACLWIFAYGSGLYPYLGVGRVDNRSAPGMQTDIASTGIGIKTMLLFKGQTAFFDYEVTSPESEVTFDLKPLGSFGYTDAMHRVRGAGAGTAQFPVTETGVYVFRHEPALGRRHGHTRYSVSWGAR